MRLAAAIAMLAVCLSACANSGQRLTAYAATAETAPAAVRDSAMQWMANRGIHNMASYNTDGSISFTYGSDVVQTMSRDKFKDFVRARLANQTVATGRRPDLTQPTGLTLTQIMYHGPDGRFAAWTTERPDILRGTYVVKEEKDVLRQWPGGVGLLVCMKLDQRMAVTATGQPLSETCRPAYEYITAIYGKQAGDVFGLSNGAAPGPLDAANPPAWPDGQPLFPQKAPHE